MNNQEKDQLMSEGNKLPDKVYGMQPQPSTFTINQTHWNVKGERIDSLVFFI